MSNVELPSSLLDAVQSNADNVWYAFKLYKVVIHKNIPTPIILFFKLRLFFVHLLPIAYHAKNESTKTKGKTIFIMYLTSVGASHSHSGEETKLLKSNVNRLRNDCIIRRSSGGRWINGISGIVKLKYNVCLASMENPVWSVD